jgi:lipopolysaccharide export system permease protein
MDSEYIVLQAAGLSLYRLMLPLIGAAVVVYGVSSVTLMYISPWAVRSLQRLFFEVAHTQAYYHLRPQEFNIAFRGLVLYVERTEPEQQRLHGIFIADSRSGTAQIITAHSGELVSEPEQSQVVLWLRQGTIHRYIPEQKRYHLLQFGDYEVVLTLDNKFARPVGSAGKVRELFPEQFSEVIAQYKAVGKDYRGLLLFWHKLYALPFACMIFAGLGPALGVVHTRAGRASGYALSIVAIFVYYILLTSSDALGEETQLPPLVAAWLPNVCMGGVTLWLLRRTARGRS